MGDELAAEEFGFDQRGEPTDPVGLGPAEGPDVVGVGVEFEDVGSVDFWMEAPHSIDAGRIAKGPIARDEGLILSGEFDDSRVVEHSEQFDAAGAHEAIAKLGLVGAKGFAEEDERLHSMTSRCLSSASISRITIRSPAR